MLSTIRVNLPLFCRALFFFISLFVVQASAFAAIHRTNGKIAFASDRDGNREIYVMNADGTNQMRLTNNPGIDDYPSWSPDGTKIAYLSQNASSGAYGIKIMNADGTGQAELTAITPVYQGFSLYGISWFPGGNKIAFSDGDDIYSINIDGTSRINLTNHPALDAQPSISHDGHRMAFTTNRDRGIEFRGPTDIYIMNLDDGSLVSLGSSPGSYWSEFSPDWSRSGQLVWVVDDFIDGGWITAGPGVTIVGEDDVDDVDSPKWSPDGKEIVYTDTYLPSGDQIFVHDNQTSINRQLTTGPGSNVHASWQPAFVSIIDYDFDGDGRSDIGITRPNGGNLEWWLSKSTDNSVFSTVFGVTTDIPVSGDFTGDGKADIAVFRPSNGNWFVLRSEDFTFVAFPFGLSGDIPMPADYDGDGLADPAVFRPSSGTWYIARSSDAGVTTAQFGLWGDQPVAADYDGDGRADIAVYRNNNGAQEWWIQGSSSGLSATVFGAAGDKAIPGDYTGDGKVDIAVWRPSNGNWFILRSEDLSYLAFLWGANGDIPVPGDYDGDGKTDAAVFRQSSATWFINRTGGAGPLITNFGAATDQPVAGVFVR